MKHTTRAVVISGLAGLACVASGQRTLMYAFRGGNPGFDADGQLFAYIKAGLAPNGNPFTDIRDDNKLYGRDGRVAGNPIFMGEGRDRKRVGFRSAVNRNTWVYELDQGTMSDAYKQLAIRRGNLAPTGTLDINAHGYFREVNGRRGQNDTDPVGTGIVLDEGKHFAGFAGGTGTTGFPIYAIAETNARARIAAEIYSCWSSLDPDGDGRAFRSVASTLDDVPGIESVAGSAVVVSYQVTPNWRVVGRPPRGLTRRLVNDGLRGLLKGIEGAENFTEVGSWISALAFDAKYRALVDHLSRVEIPDGKGGVFRLNLKWELDITRNNTLSSGDRGPLSSNPRFDFPTGLDSSIGGPVDNSIENELHGTAWITRMEDRDDTPGLEVLQLLRRGEAIEYPEGLDSISGIYQLLALDGMLESASAAFEVSINPSLIQDIAGIYVLDETGWVALPTTRIGDDILRTGTIGIESLGLGRDSIVFAAFGTVVPAPGTLAIGALASVIAARRRRPACV